MKQVRVGVVGIGNMGSAHAVSIFQGKAGGLSLAAVCDISRSRREWAEAAFDGRVKIFSDYRELLKDGELEAVIIATPHFLHPEIAGAALKGGFHVLTEKPAGVFTSAVRRMNAAAAESGKVFSIMLNQRTDPLFQRLKESIEEGRLGEIKSMVWIVNNWYRTQAYYDSGSWRGTWSGEGGGILINQCPHNLDIWQWLIGVPDRIRAVCRTARYHDIQVEDDVAIYAEYQSGVSACFISSTGEYPGTNRLEISGSRGKAVAENGKLRLYLMDCDERELCRSSEQAMPEPPVSFEEYGEEETEDGHILILRNFAAAIRNGEKLIAPGEEGLNSLWISNAAYLSQWTGDWVELPLNEVLFEALLKERQEREKQDFSDALRHQKEEPQEAAARGREPGTSDEVYERRWSVRW
ncbi:Gfo/Idh/MocA family protein [Lachnoclostridium sp. Marseille-P6806]|uniref:Gfo/Idh/MocA family protein n=1 Tax=Lachnoclostridium sp. Marseille-P6806 TaxID=2364793 RepID=UPI001030DC0C|nr:Gfo/Idh/MocA family oxidoreductase [Lachnoclostridium sp. Marseille-P6806]